jgi:hypothetical protein
MLGSNVTMTTKVQLKQAEAVVLGCRTNVGGGRTSKIGKLSPCFGPPCFGHRIFRQAIRAKPSRCSNKAAAERAELVNFAVFHC